MSNHQPRLVEGFLDEELAVLVASAWESLRGQGRLLIRQAELLTRQEALMDREEALMKRREGLMDREERDAMPCQVRVVHH